MGRPRWQRLTREEREEIIRRAARGETHRAIMADLDVSKGGVERVLLLNLGPAMKPEEWNPSPARLSLEERVEIKLGLERGWSMRKIAGVVGRNVSTISREVRHNGGWEDYRPSVAHRRACEQARRPKVTKLGSNPRLRRRVVRDLRRLWSPEQIARRLREEFGDESRMRISHETIYQTVYVQGRSELRKELAACLRTGRAKRKPRSRATNQGRISHMVMISERPPEVEDRAVPGHWEGDLVIGKDGDSAVGTLVERSTRYVMLLHLPRGRTAEAVRDAITKTIRTLPQSLRRTLTWDQGNELAQHLTFTIDTGVAVYFCDPHSPWQRGTNENTNGLLRQYLPKGTDLSVHSPEKLKDVADSLNQRPRKTLNWKTPSEKFAELVATIR